MSSDVGTMNNGIGRPDSKTRGEWEQEQAEMAAAADIAERDQAVFQAQRGRVVQELDKQAVRDSLRDLLSKHPTEFEKTLFTERRKRGIETEVDTDLYDYLLRLDGENET
jgi:hypothetical protein